MKQSKKKRDAIVAQLVQTFNRRVRWIRAGVIVAGLINTSLLLSSSIFLFFALTSIPLIQWYHVAEAVICGYVILQITQYAWRQVAQTELELVSRAILQFLADGGKVEELPIK